MILRRLNHAQRVVIVVAFGLALYALGNWVTTLGTRLPSQAMEYSSVSAPAAFGGFYPWVRFAIWMLLLAIWAAISIPVLSNRLTDEPHR
jgi:hypothetical protein